MHISFDWWTVASQLPLVAVMLASLLTSGGLLRLRILTATLMASSLVWLVLEVQVSGRFSWP